MTFFDYDRTDVARSCARKKPYTDIKFAKRVARQIRERIASGEIENRGQTVVVYACRNCGNYHVGGRRVESTDRTDPVVGADSEREVRRHHRFGKGHQRTKEYRWRRP